MTTTRPQEVILGAISGRAERPDRTNITALVSSAVTTLNQSFGRNPAETVDRIDRAIGELHRARELAVHEANQAQRASMNRTSASLAERKGVACLHADDSRHSRRWFGPPVYVGCGCTDPCCEPYENSAVPPEREVDRG